MGMHADDLRHWEIRQSMPYNEFFDGPKPQKLTKFKWTTKNGDVICLEDMTTEHIENIIAKLAREGKAPIKQLELELAKRR